MTNLLKAHLGFNDIEEYENFDISEAQYVLKKLAIEQPMDLAEYEKLQQRSLYAADLLVEYMTKLNKTISILENKIDVKRSKVFLEYKSPDGKTTAEMRKSASESDSEISLLNEQVGKAKGAKFFLDKKYELLIKAHHHYKDLASSIRNTGNTNVKNTYNQDEYNNSW